MAQILVADDSKTIRKIICGEILSAGHTVAGEAADGNELVEQYKRLTPDYVTIDITMDGLNGFDAIKAIKRFDPKARICIVSALFDPAAKQQADSLGVEDYVVKPFEPETLINIFQKIV